MQEENKNDVPMVDIDTSGEDTEVILENPKPENEVETKEDSLAPRHKLKNLKKRR